MKGEILADDHFQRRFLLTFIWFRWAKNLAGDRESVVRMGGI